jgi:hypothetical protein
MLKARRDRDSVGAASVDYLMFGGYMMMAYFWALQAQRADALRRSDDRAESADFYNAKLQTAEFYFERLLPRAQAHARSALASTQSLMQMPNDHFGLSR